MATLGLNVQGVEKIKKALDDYAQDIYGKNQITVIDPKIRNAFKGTTVELQIKELSKTIENKIDDCMEKIQKKFEAKTADVVAAYKKQDASSTAVSDVTKDVQNSLKS